MAVVGWREIVKGSGVSGKYGDSNTYTRCFLIRVDHPGTSKVQIASAPGIVYGSPHPDQSNCKAMEFDCQHGDDVGLWWTLTVRYYIPPPETTPEENGLPKDCWAANGGTSTGPAYKDVTGSTIVNSAGDPLEGIERENDDISWTLTKAYEDLEWNTTRLEKSNTVNESTWNDGDPGTWKVNFRGAQKKEITQKTTTGGGDDQGDGTYSPATATETKLSYWEVHWEFRYRREGWNAKPWDVGFNQLCDSSGNPSTSGSERRAILGKDGKAVKQPVALASGIAKPAGQAPDIANGGDGFEIYEQTSFTVFGEPS